MSNTVTSNPNVPKSSSRRFWRGFRFTGLVLRELIGWALMGCGLYVFRTCFAYLNTTPSQLIQAVVAAMIGAFLFRSGLQLVKVAVAARAYERPIDPHPM